MGQKAAPSFSLKFIPVVMRAVLPARIFALTTAIAESTVGSCSWAKPRMQNENIANVTMSKADFLIIFELLNRFRIGARTPRRSARSILCERFYRNSRTSARVDVGRRIAEHFADSNHVVCCGSTMLPGNLTTLV